MITKFDARNIEYLRHGDGPLLARLYTPRGPGPFPLLVECHGGGWCANDRFAKSLRHEALAAHGVIATAMANMAEGNPVLALERSERVHMPAAIYFQAHEDALHNYRDPDSPSTATSLIASSTTTAAPTGESPSNTWTCRRTRSTRPTCPFVRMAAFVREHTI